MKPNRRAVRCSACNKFILNLEVTADSMPVGSVCEIRDIRCKCGFVNHISVGIADMDTRGNTERVEEKLREQLKQED